MAPFSNSELNKNELIKVIHEKQSDVEDLSLSNDGREVAVYIADYVAMKCMNHIKNCDACELTGILNDKAA